MWRILVLAAFGCSSGSGSGSGSKSEIKAAIDDTGVISAIAADDQGLAWSSVAHEAKDSKLKYRAAGGKVISIATGYVLEIALQGDAVFWSDRTHIWRADRDGARASQVLEVPDEVYLAGADSEFVYYVAWRLVGRIAKNGTNEILARIPEDTEASFKKLAFDGGRIVASVSHFGSDHTGSEIRRIDGGQKVLDVMDVTDGQVNNLTIDGDRVVWSVERKSPQRHEVFSRPLAGGPRAHLATGTLIAAREGAIYLTRRELAATFLLNAVGQRRIGPEVLHGVLVGKRLYASFQTSSLKSTIGYLSVE
ncbi:MAG: hypothetical protein WKG01_15180 [Kofleriaceae bacterium]